MQRFVIFALFAGFTLAFHALAQKPGLENVHAIIDSTTVQSEQPKTEWQLQVNGFTPAYFDARRKAIAINTVKQPTDKWGAAQKRFTEETGMYTVTLTSILETDGECSYIVKIDGKTILEFTNPRIMGTEVKEYSLYKKHVENIPIKKGALVQVEFLPHSNQLVKEGKGFGFARARWQDVEFKKQ